jgi:hypothetical protein
MTMTGEEIADRKSLCDTPPMSAQVKKLRKKRFQPFGARVTIRIG